MPSLGSTTTRARALAVALATTCLARCAPVEPGRDCAPRDPSSAPRDAAVGYVPYLADEYSRVYVPPGDAGSARYLNDHTLVRGPDGAWHLFGITNTGSGMPFGEHALLHATAPRLRGPWTDRPDALAADASRGEGCCLWAPHVVALPGATPRYLMVYATDGGGLRRATSADLATWTRVEGDADATTRPPGGRDPFLLRDGDRWVLYSVGVDAATDDGQIVATWTRGDPSTATDWSPAVAVTTDPVPSFSWGDLESPTVVPYGGQYYLVTTRTADDGADYVRTVVLRSSDALAFSWAPITDLRAHAAEVVPDDEADRLVITSAGWPGYIGEPNRGLLLAPLGWAAE